MKVYVEKIDVIEKSFCLVEQRKFYNFSKDKKRTDD